MDRALVNRPPTLQIKVSQWDFFNAEWDSPTQRERARFVERLMQREGYALGHLEKRFLDGWELTFRKTDDACTNEGAPK